VNCVCLSRHDVLSIHEAIKRGRSSLTDGGAIAISSNLVYDEVFYAIVARWFLLIANFYCAMHYSAKRGIAIACRPSVSPSVCNVGGSGPHRL